MKTRSSTLRKTSTSIATRARTTSTSGSKCIDVSSSNKSTTRRQRNKTSQSSSSKKSNKNKQCLITTTKKRKHDNQKGSSKSKRRRMTNVVQEKKKATSSSVSSESADDDSTYRETPEVENESHTSNKDEERKEKSKDILQNKSSNPRRLHLSNDDDDTSKTLSEQHDDDSTINTRNTRKTQISALTGPITRSSSQRTLEASIITNKSSSYGLIHTVNTRRIRSMLRELSKIHDEPQDIIDNFLELIDEIEETSTSDKVGKQQSRKQPQRKGTNEFIISDINDIEDTVMNLPTLAVPRTNNSVINPPTANTSITDKASYASKMKDVNNVGDDNDSETIDELYIDKNLEPIRLEEIEAKDDHMLRRIVDMLYLPEYYKHVMPSYESRFLSESIQQDIPSRFNRMVNFIVKCFEIITSSICPGPSLHSLREASINRLGHLIIKNNKSKTKRSNEGSKQNKLSNKINDSVYEPKWDRLADVVCNCAKALKKGSIERRVSRAILYNGVTIGDFKKLLRKHDMKFGHSQPMRQAKADYEELVKGNKLEKKKVTFSRVSDDDVKFAVEFILSPENIVTRSYGVKDVTISKHETIRLPRIQRTKSRKMIINEYIEHASRNTSVQMLSKTSMYYILNEITSSDVKTICAVDYVSTILVNDTVEVLQNIIDKCIPPEKVQYTTDLLSSVSFLLKHDYSKLVMQRGTGISYHGIDHALSKDDIPRNKFDCNACRYPFYFCHRLKEMIRENTNVEVNNDMKKDALKVIDDTRQKFVLYMAHVCRCKCQSVGIKRVEDNYRDKCKSSKGKLIDGILILDFKMKFESKSTRESTIEHFGKRGIGWHGCALIYHRYEEVCDSAGETQLDENGNPLMEVVKKIVYIDQILEDNNKQDGLSVIGLLECALTHIAIRFPFIQNITLQSDNAATYQNHELLIGIHFINMKLQGQLLVKQFIHSETQDGKTILDAHFAVAVIVLLEFMKTSRANRITKIQTPSGLAKALSSNGGTRNSIVQLVELDREYLEKIKDMLKDTVKQGKEYYSRSNHITFDNPPKKTTASLEDYSKASFNLEVSAFSGIDYPIDFYIDIGENKYVPDDDGLDRINDAMMEYDIADADEDGIDIEQDEITNNTGSNNNKSNSKGVDFEYVKLNRHQRRRGIMSRRFKSSDVDLYTVEQLEQFAINKDDKSDDISVSSDSSSNISTDSDDETNNTDDSPLTSRAGYAQPTNQLLMKESMLTRSRIIMMKDVDKVRTSMPTTKNKKNKEVIQKINKNIEPQQKDAVARAIRTAKDVFTNTKQILDYQDTDPNYILAKDYTPSIQERKWFYPGWARRPKHGHLYGTNYIDEFKNDLINMFDVGSKDSSRKMNAGKMRERLICLYPNRFSIPSELEIKKFTAAQFQKSKYTRKNQGEARSNSRQYEEWQMQLDRMITATSKPQDVYEKFVEHAKENNITFPTLENGEPDKNKIKSKINQRKTQKKKEAKKSLLS